MPTYDEVLNQVQQLAPAEQMRLLGQLQEIVFQPVEVEGEDEAVSAAEIAGSHAAWQDYLAKRDRGISSKELKLKAIEQNQLPSVDADPLIGLFSGSPDLATKFRPQHCSYFDI